MIRRYTLKIKDNDYFAEDEMTLKCPIDTAIMPNYLGINLNSVDCINWSRQDDDQLIDLSIKFIPKDLRLDYNSEHCNCDITIKASDINTGSKLD